jgi:hypothetical protein
MEATMRIASATLQMESSHSEQQKNEVSESLRNRIGGRSRAESGLRVALGTATSSVQISETGQAKLSNEVSSIRDSISAAENDPKLSLIRAMVALITGRDIQIYSTSTLQGSSSSLAVTTAQPQAASPSGESIVEYSRHESYSESEQTSFSAAGVINTTDGKQIDFSLSLSMSRSYYEELNSTITIGDSRQLQDPLVLNFDGEAAQLTDQRFAFDLNSDGQSESINFVAGGSGFLALDRNGDGSINDGSELFGAQSGNGFTELAKLDDDHNGWIDENDAAFTQLQVWTKDRNGNDQLSSLKDANVGAIGLDHVATSFDIKDANNELQGRIRSSGVFLQEDGKVGSVQQIDLTI